MTNPNNLTLEKFHDGLVKKEFSALEVTQELFAKIKETDKKIGAYLSLSEETAIRQAEQVDLKIAKNETISPLAGAPLAIKDNILIEGLPCTSASKILEHYVASYDAAVIKKLKSEDAVFLGKTNMDEFAMGASTENSALLLTRNPHDPERVPGGSSGGSAAAVATHMALAALGSDTGGSIREPAAFCGVVGLKPTYGSVSRHGLTAMASSLDQIGPITKTVHDAAILFSAIQGEDGYDATSAPVTYKKSELLQPKYETVTNLKIGIPKEYFKDGGIDDVVRNTLEKTIFAFKSMKVEFKEISLPHSEYAPACYYIIVPAEVSSNTARFDGIRYARLKQGLKESESLTDLYRKQRGLGFGPEVKRRIILGTFVLSSGYYDAYYAKAQKVRTLIKQDFDNAFKEVDVIFAPTYPSLPFKIGEKVSDPLAMYLADIFTIPVNLAGLPAISIPTEPPGTIYDSTKLPVGFQLIGKPFREADILGLGQYYEKLGAS
ncbi:MAG: Asp-tRNA(Asn)/Glu-tRNA(Gln) amidotransferase subunit GatA [Patescibacteria group bacterium]